MNPFINTIQYFRDAPQEGVTSHGGTAWGLSKPQYFRGWRLWKDRVRAAWWLLIGRGELLLYGRHHWRLIRQSEKEMRKAKSVPISNEEIERITSSVCSRDTGVNDG